MRHQGSFRKFSRSPAHRRAMFRNLTTSLIDKERFETTVAKAKDLRRVVEKLITMASQDNLHNRRLAYDYMTNKGSVHKLFTDVAPRFKGRPGGFTRVIRTRVRPGDAAEMAIIELVEGPRPTEKKRAAKSSSSKNLEENQSENDLGAASQGTNNSDKTANPEKTVPQTRKKKEVNKRAAGKEGSKPKPASKKAATPKKAKE